MPDIDVNAGWQWVVDQCNDPNVGYSQGDWNQPGGRNAVKDSYGRTFYDCSSLMNYACLNMGFDIPGYAPDSNPWVTSVMPAQLASLGWVQVGTGGEIKPGDIGLNPATHTEMCYTGGTMATATWMGAHGQDPSKYTWEQQVSIGGTKSSWEQVWRYGEGGTGEPSAKFSFYVCAAICGNWYVESGCNPGIWESLTPVAWDAVWQRDAQGNGTGGYGLGQWTNTNGDTHGRLYQLYSYLMENNYDQQDGDAQLEFMVKEKYWDGALNRSELDEFLSSDSEDIDELTRQFNFYWEGINNGTLPDRQENARIVYDYLQDHWQDDVKWKAYNNWTSYNDWLNNSVCIYQWLNLNYAGGSNSGTGGGTTSGSNGGTPSTQMGDTTTSDIYNLLYSLLGLLGGSKGTEELLKILTRRGK